MLGRGGEGLDQDISQLGLTAEELGKLSMDEVGTQRQKSVTFFCGRLFETLKTFRAPSEGRETLTAKPKGSGHG